VYTSYDPSNSALNAWGRRVMQQAAGNTLSHFLDTLNVVKVASELKNMCNNFLVCDFRIKMLVNSNNYRAPVVTRTT
jgi:hypothetical protein